MSSKNRELLEELIRIELNAARLYTCFCELFGEDREFWCQLAHEEKEHAALLKGCRTFVETNVFPKHFLYLDLAELERVNGEVEKLLKKYKKHPPSRQAAFHSALSLEKSMGESHFEELSEGKSRSGFLKVFSQLVGDSRHHTERIRKKMRHKKIN